MTDKIFQERVDAKACEWLLTQLSVDAFNDQLTDEDKHNQINFTATKKILNEYKNNKGILKTKYNKSPKDIHRNLRDYGRGIQSIPSVFRGLICRNNMTDVDMKNCHPTILYQLCLKYNVPCKYLSEYVLNRSELLAKNGLTKMDIIKSMFKKTYVRNGNTWFKCFDAEMKTIQKTFISNPDFVKQKEQSLSNRQNQEGSFMSSVCTSVEVLILDKILSGILLPHDIGFKGQSPLVEIGVLMFDGFMFYGERPNDFLTTLNALGKEVGFNMEWTYKEHDTRLNVPDDYETDDPDVLYALTKEKYERDYKMAFIDATNNISYKIDGVVHYFSKADMMFKLDDVRIKDEPFFPRWSKDPTKQRFNSVGVYPHDRTCPDSIMNLWNGYDVEKIEPLEKIEPNEAVPNETNTNEPNETNTNETNTNETNTNEAVPDETNTNEAVPDAVPTDLFMNHLKIICKESVVLEFLLDWIANMFQYPSSQSIMVVIQGEEGSGKSVICDFITKILGHDYCIEINNVEHALFGRFNSQLVNKVFVNINEIDRASMTSYMEQLKAIITQPTLPIEVKGKNRFDVNNLLHLLSTLNNENAFKITEASRRFMYFETFNGLIGNTEYFNALFHYIEQPKHQRHFYELMMNRPVKKKITIKDIPITDDMRKQFEFNRDPIEDYASDFTFKLTAMENYNAYKAYLLVNGLKFEKPKKAFEMTFVKYMEKNEIYKKDLMVDGGRGRYYIKKGYEKPPTDV